MFARVVSYVLALLVVNSLTAQILDPRLQINPNQAPFYHGVASGDPLHDRVILWTRISPAFETTQPVEVAWEIATDTAMQQVVATGSVTTGAYRDYTVKADATGLQPATSYYYRFSYQNSYSPIGRTLTAPHGDDISEWRMAVLSCSNYQYGYFNAYRDIVNKNDVDVVLHLGDYIYEYEVGRYDAGLDGRVHLPKTETVTLSDYRLRYSHYRLDDDLQELHRQFPFIAVWDDHETNDNAHKTGADNHSSDEGDWNTRKISATQAYLEWMPVREQEVPGRIYRHFNFGNLLDLYMLDTRLEARDAQASIGSSDISNTERRLLGDTQFNWLKRKVQQSEARWHVLGQQVMMAPLRLGGLGINTDQWDGYTFERDRLFEFFQNSDSTDLVVLTGDIHSSWANELPTALYSDVSQGASVGVEFICTSVTSPGWEIPVAGSAIALNNPHIKYVDLYQRGYMVVHLDTGYTQADYFFSETIAQRNSKHRLGASYKTLRGTKRLIETGKPSERNQPKVPLAPRFTKKAQSESTAFAVFGTHPNPFARSFKMQFFASDDSSAQLRVFSEVGQEVKQQTLHPKAGVNYVEVSTQELENGLYTIMLEVAGETKGFSMIKK